MRGASSRLLTPLLLLCAGPVAAQGAAQAAPRLPAYRGRVERSTLAPGGLIDGLLLADGTEVKTPPYLSTQMGVAIGPGDRVTVHGLESASLSLVQAVSVEASQVSPAYRPGSVVVAEGDATTTPYGTAIRAGAVGARLAGSAPGRSP